MKQARFWIDHKGDFVRIKLDAGQSLGHSYGGETDEGYSWTAQRYSFDGHLVVSEWHTDSRDCDGRMTQSGEATCGTMRLAAGHSEGGISFPAWEHEESGQRDYSAEAMGY